VGCGDGACEGASESDRLGAWLGFGDGVIEGKSEGIMLGFDDGFALGLAVGGAEGAALGKSLLQTSGLHAGPQTFGNCTLATVKQASVSLILYVSINHKIRDPHVKDPASSTAYVFQMILAQCWHPHVSGVRDGAGDPDSINLKAEGDWVGISSGGQSICS